MSRDQELIKRCLAGDLDAFRDLIEPHQASVFRIALSVLGNREEAEEATQDAFVRVYRGLHSFRGDAAFRGWVYRVAVNTCYNASRRVRRRRAVEKSMDPRSLPETGLDDKPSPESEIADREIGRKVRELIRRLPKKLYEVVVLSYLRDLSHEEIADALGIPRGTVKSRLHLARERLGREITRTGLLE
jgi:RNA polymerase sigma-70 factor (ECF subfamily)